jgi:hypothetical protein
MGNASKLINQLILNKESANVCEIDVTEDTSNDLSGLLFDDFWNNIGLKVHHVVSKVGFDEGLHDSSLCLVLNKHLNDLHNLVVGSLSPQVIPPLFVFCLTCYLFWRGGVILSWDYYHAVRLLICDWNVWNIFEWGRTFIEWIVDCTLEHGVWSLFITLKDQSGIM